jgi:hypothetical protein
MSTTRRLLLILTILFSCVGCDQATKSVAKAYLSETHTVVLLGDTVRLQLAKNYGAFLSLGSSVGEASRGVLFSVVVGAVLAALLVYLFISKPENPIVGVSVALIVGGGERPRNRLVSICSRVSTSSRSCIGDMGILTLHALRGGTTSLKESKPFHAGSTGASPGRGM